MLAEAQRSAVEAEHRQREADDERRAAEPTSEQRQLLAEVAAETRLDGIETNSPENKELHMFVQQITRRYIDSVFDVVRLPVGVLQLAAGRRDDAAWPPCLVLASFEGEAKRALGALCPMTGSPPAAGG